MNAHQLAWYTTEDLMARWDVSRDTVWRRVRSGLRALRGRDGGFRVREDWLLDFEEQESQKLARPRSAA